MKNLLKNERGFTLIEILVVIAIVGTMAAVVQPSIGKLFNTGETESYQTELHNIRNAVLAMLAESTDQQLNPVGPTDDMGTVRTTDSPSLVLNDYLTVLNGTKVKSGCTYTFAADGSVIQATPP